jgi:hypothetical protein
VQQTAFGRWINGGVIRLDSGKSLLHVLKHRGHK